ncbi:MAG: sulfoxide reductase heme-binding subunit YedZ [Acidobacteriota bacterium]|nr:sulfoxide reductase heme-binding subunit YedZ [Acidobacteriota bacterium]
MLIRWLKVVVFISCLLPAARLAWRGYQNALGANPIEVITHSTGDLTLIFLLVTLSITPLRQLLRQPWLIRFRRMFGLFAFFYVSLHFTTYVWLDKFSDIHEILKDVAKRKFITVGFAAFVMLIPLAITSTAGWIRRLGGKRWRAIHRLIYFSAIAGVIHYLWLVKADKHKPLEYAAVLAILLGYRLAVWIRRSLRERNSRSLPAISPEVTSA